MKKLLILVLAMSSLISFAQRGHKDSNRIGISAGVSQLNIFTSNFDITPKTGWIGGFHVRGNYYNDWQMSFGMSFTDSNFSVQTKNANGLIKDTNYKLSGVQVYLLPGYVISENHFNIEFGPVLQVNGALKVDSNDEKNTLVALPNLTAKDITEITKINANIYAGVNFGFTNLRARIGYQYGVTNLFGNLNKEEVIKTNAPNEKFKGNLGMISGQITLYL